MLEKQKKRRQEMAETNEQQRELARRQKEQIRLADLKVNMNHYWLMVINGW